jgi:hypothetical protein
LYLNYLRRNLMKKILNLLFIVTIAVGLTACQNYRGRDIGAVTGAAGGAAIGSAVSGGSVIGAAVGAGGGAVVGHEVGKSMEK